jgi:peptidoglycan hydrolase FlgJ
MNTTAITSTPQPTTAETQRQARLTNAAHQFEATFLQELLKPLQSSDNSDGAADTLQSYGTEALAQAISSRGGLGIARQVMQQITRSDSQHQNTQKNLSTP